MQLIIAFVSIKETQTALVTLRRSNQDGQALKLVFYVDMNGRKKNPGKDLHLCNNLKRKAIAMYHCIQIDIF